MKLAIKIHLLILIISSPVLCEIVVLSMNNETIECGVSIDAEECIPAICIEAEIAGFGDMMHWEACEDAVLSQKWCNGNLVVLLANGRNMLGLSNVAGASYAAIIQFERLGNVAEIGNQNINTVHCMDLPIGNNVIYAEDNHSVDSSAYLRAYVGTGSVRIVCSMEEGWNKELCLYDVMGRLVKSVSMVSSDGLYSYSWNHDDGNGNRVASGVYFAVVEGNDQILSRKFVLIK